MRKLYLILLGLFFAFPVWADESLEPLLNKVTLQLKAEQWVTTKTALVSVGVNAAVTSMGIDRVQTDVLQKLNQFSNKAEWHIVSFDRQLDKSGLESIQIIAQARLAQSDLANLRDKAKAISKPGETFTIDNVQFTPSDDELRQANIALRNNLYLQTKAEIDTLNKTYPDQKYYLHQIDFMLMPPVAPIAMGTANVYMAKMANNPAPLSVGNKQELQATIVLAAMPDVVAQKLAQH